MEIPEYKEGMDVLAYLETNYPDLVKKYEIDSNEFILPTGKMFSSFRVHKPEMISFPNKNLKLKIGVVYISIEHDCFILVLWKEVLTSHLTILQTINREED